jgi:hypothetical protein
MHSIPGLLISIACKIAHSIARDLTVRTASRESAAPPVLASSDTSPDMATTKTAAANASCHAAMDAETNVCVGVGELVVDHATCRSIDVRGPLHTAANH